MTSFCQIIHSLHSYSVEKGREPSFHLHGHQSTTLFFSLRSHRSAPPPHCIATQIQEPQPTVLNADSFLQNLARHWDNTKKICHLLALQSLGKLKIFRANLTGID
ncbi:hypothetical protein JHK85_045748 [Glycine max]|nr:hypothetical protein JHK85_045748 [Glycine max]